MIIVKIKKGEIHMKRLVALCAVTTVTLGLATASVWAGDVTTAVQPKRDAVTTTVMKPKSSVRVVPVRPNKDQLIQKSNSQIQKFEDLIQTAIQKAKDKRDTGLQKLQTKEDKMQVALTNAERMDGAEKQALDNDIAKWTDYQQKMEAGVNERIAKIDTDLQKSLTDIDAKIVAATDDTTKQNLIAQKTTLQTQADTKKTALQAYLVTFKGIWTDRQKVWDMRKDLLTRRQAADSELRKALQGVTQTKIDNATTVISKTDAQIEIEIRARYQKAIDAAKARLQNLQGQTLPITPVTEQPIIDSTVSTQSTIVPAVLDNETKTIISTQGSAETQVQQ